MPNREVCQTHTSFFSSELTRVLSGKSGQRECSASRKNGGSSCARAGRRAYLVTTGGAIGGSKYQFKPARAMFSRNGVFAVKVPQQLTPVADGSKSTNKYSSVNDQCGRNIHSKPAPAAQPARTLEDDPVVQLKRAGQVASVNPVAIALKLVSICPYASPPVP